jgi:hypothetical protein
MAPRQTCSTCNSSSQKPGVYVDHDDIAPTLGDLVGFKHARGEHKVFVNSFSASAPAHPSYLVSAKRSSIIMRSCYMRASAVQQGRNFTITLLWRSRTPLRLRCIMAEDDQQSGVRE